MTRMATYLPKAVMHVFFFCAVMPTFELSGHLHHLQSPLLSKFRWTELRGISAVRVLMPGRCNTVQTL